MAMSTSSGPGTTTKGPAPSIEALRLRHQVRPLQPHEEGQAIGALPPGLYGYTYAPAQDEIPVFSKGSYHSFEVHKTSNGSELLIGFVTPAESQAIENNHQGAPIRIFPEPRENAQCLVSVPLSQMGAGKRSPREDGNPLLFTIA
jgi:hypothetical protein